MAVIAWVTATPARKRTIELVLLVLLVLAFTLPFVGQAIHVDAQLDIDWARQELVHPLWQHLPDYDYFGYHYDAFHDTHPRLESLYLSVFLRLAGGVSESLLHLAMLPFPIIAALSMYWLARRFRAHALIATLLLLVSPAFLVNTQLIMKDIPGIALWLAGLAFYIAGVDRRRFWLMAVGGLWFTASVFVFYQGLSVLPLAFLYLLINRRIEARSMIALFIPIIAFVAFVSAHFAYYGEVPNTTYPPPVGLPMAPETLLMRVGGVGVMVGGAALLPGLALWLFPKSRSSVYFTATVYLLSTFWVAYAYLQGALPVEHLLLVPLMLASGAGVVWHFTSRFFSSLWPALRARAGQDTLFLSAWFVGTFFYCAVLMPYASPRFMIPLIPPLAIVVARKVQKRWGADREKFIKAVTIIVTATFVLAMGVAIAENQRAQYNRDEAQWVAANVGDIEASGPPAGPQGHTVWFEGYLGFQYYLEPYGYRMLMVEEDQPAKGDLIVQTYNNGLWPFSKDLSKRVQLVKRVDFTRNWPLTTYNFASNTSWVGFINVTLPYAFTGDFVERLDVYRVESDPVGDTEGEDYCTEDGHA